MTRTPHVALVAWAFPPARSSGVYRALALSQALVDLGARVTVVTADERYFELVTGTDESLRDHVPTSVAVRRVPYVSRRQDPVVDHWPMQRVVDRNAWFAAEAQRERSYFLEPQYGPWRPALERAVHGLHDEDPVDLVIGTGVPYTSYAAAAHLHATAGVPYVLDDRDAWLLDVFSGRIRPGFADVEPWLESLTAGALESWYVNPPLAQWHRDRFPHLASRIHVVENGWDRSLLDPELTGRSGAGPLRVGFIGTINAGFPLRMLLEGWRAARGRGVPADAELHLVGPLGHQGATPEHERLLAGARGDGVVVRGPWPKARLADAYAELDVLLFAKEGGELVTSGKIYEYMATGKPVVVAADSAQDARRVIAGYPRAHVATDLAAPGVAAALEAAVADAGDPAGEEPARRVGARWERGAVLRPAVARVLEVVGRADA